MRRSRWFWGVGDTPMEVYWSAGDQACNWIAEMAEHGPLTYREIKFWAPSIAIATVGYAQ